VVKNIKWGRISIGEEYQVGKNIKMGRRSSWEEYHVGKNIKWEIVGKGRGRKGLGMQYYFFLSLQYEKKEGGGIIAHKKELLRTICIHTGKSIDYGLSTL
jgi:hypothetical protein